MTVLVWCVLAVLVLWLLLQRRTLRSLRDSLDSARREIYGVQYELHEKAHALESEIQATRLDAQAHAGELRVGPSATVADVVALHARAREVLAYFQIGGEHPEQSTETLQSAALTYGHDLRDILVQITLLLEHPDTWQPPAGGCGAGPQEPVQIQPFSV